MKEKLEEKIMNWHSEYILKNNEGKIGTIYFKNLKERQKYLTKSGNEMAKYIGEKRITDDFVGDK